VRLKNLSVGFGKWMNGYRAGIRARVEKINAYHEEKGKDGVPMPGFDGAAKDFAELFVYGPGGRPALHKEARPFASFDPAKRKAIGLRAGRPGELAGCSWPACRAFRQPVVLCRRDRTHMLLPVCPGAPALRR
jgi:hypothetical protein